MPFTEKQRRFFRAELGRKRAGKKTKTGMSEEALREHASGPLKKKKKQPRGPLSFGFSKRG